MNGTKWMTVVLVAAAALAAAGATRLGAPEADEIRVVVAARELRPGVVITADDLYGYELPSRFVADGMLSAPSYVVGRVARERILAHEIVRDERLADLGVSGECREIVIILGGEMRTELVDEDGNLCEPLVR